MSDSNSFCKDCKATYSKDLAVFQSAWNVAGDVSIKQDIARQAIVSLFRLSHARIFDMLGEATAARIYPTPKRYPGVLLDGDLWWTIHATGGTSIKSVISWFGGAKYPDDAGRLKTRGGSTNFVIDTDGMVWSVIHPNDGAWHCPGRNRDSLSVELVNACGLKSSMDPKRGRYFKTWSGVPYVGPDPIHIDVAWRGFEYWQPYDERQIYALLKLMRLCHDALGWNRFDHARIAPHSAFNEHKLDPGPAFPMAYFERVAFEKSPLRHDPLVDAMLDRSNPRWEPGTALTEDEFNCLKWSEYSTNEDDLEDAPTDPDPRLELKMQQERLMVLGFGTEITGYYGAETKKAVLAFQKAWNREHQPNRIVEDGILGPITRRCLDTEFSRYQSGVALDD